VVDYVKYWTERTELPKTKLISWLGVGASKFYQWQERYGLANEHNGQVPRDFWLEEWEKRAIVDFHDRHPLDGYRRLTFMMLDDDVVAVSPSSVYRTLKTAGRLATTATRGGARASSRRRRKARALCSRSRRMTTGTWIFPT
jgi:hypothetical protein